MTPQPVMAEPRGDDGGDGGAHREYHHPYTPYDIQLRFMHAVYECIDQGRIGVFESPTGKILLFIINSSTRGPVLHR